MRSAVSSSPSAGTLPALRLIPLEGKVGTALPKEGGIALCRGGKRVSFSLVELSEELRGNDNGILLHFARPEADDTAINDHCRVEDGGFPVQLVLRPVKNGAAVFIAHGVFVVAWEQIGCFGRALRGRRGGGEPVRLPVYDLVSKKGFGGFEAGPGFGYFQPGPPDEIL